MACPPTQAARDLSLDPGTSAPCPCNGGRAAIASRSFELVWTDGAATSVSAGRNEFSLDLAKVSDLAIVAFLVDPHAIALERAAG